MPHSYIEDMASSKSVQKRTRTAVQTAPDLFKQGVPEGFQYQAEVLSPREALALVAQFKTLPFKPFEFHGYLGNRRIVSYGHRYDYAAHVLRQSDEMPGFLGPLRAIAARFAGLAASTFQQALVTEYAPGAGIGWHRDKPMFESIVALSFLAPCDLRLRRKCDHSWHRCRIPIAPRSAYLLRGAVRENWEHSILPMEQARYSVTFRTFSPNYQTVGNVL